MQRQLRHFLKRGEIDELLTQFLAPWPTADLALLSADGRPFAGTGQWSQPQLRELLAAARDGEMMQAGDGILVPLFVKSELIGAIAARGSMPESALRGPAHTLCMLIEQALEKRDIARETLDRYRELNLLYEVARTIGSCLDADEIPALELAEAERAVRADAGAVLLGKAPDSLTVAAGSGEAEDVAALQAISRSLVADVYATGHPDMWQNGSSAPAPLAAVLCVPLIAHDRVVGVTLLGRCADGAMFTAGEQKLISALADQAAIALERARLHETEIMRHRVDEELAIGRQIQRSLLPKACPRIPGWEFTAVYRAAEEVGGDYYDHFTLPHRPHTVGLAIGDVTGKGVPAAMMMAYSRAIIRTEAMSHASPATVLRRTNRWLALDDFSQLYLTAFYANLDTQTGELVYASGGHDRPLWLQATTGECTDIQTRGMILGAMHEIAIDEGRIQIQPEDILVMYTDGVTEARRTDGEFFDKERLRSIIMAHPTASAEELTTLVLRAVEDFAGDAPQSDDITIFIAKRVSQES